jgi:hypothetical protein
VSSSTERLPAALSERLASATTNIYSRQGREVDVAIGGIPFRLATAQELPHTMETIPVRKEQVDTETEPGEQSLSGWWRRAQASWHEGAGYLYQEDSRSLTPTEGFYASRGIDVFTKGRITLLRKMVENTNVAVTASRLRAITSGTKTLSFIGTGDLYTLDAADGSATVLHNPATTLADGMVAYDYFYSVATDGTLYSGTVASPGTATTWPCGATPERLQWGKHRLWIIGGRKLWQPDLTLAAGEAQDPIFTHPNQGWTYTCMAEGPAAMYFGGNDGNTSTIQAITLENDDVPTLSGATVTATLPEGELVQEIAVVAGSIIGIGTSAGFRAGRVTTDGSITYGPLLIEPEGVTGCTAIATQGRYFLVAFSGEDGDAVAYRVDTGTELDENIYPYAADIECDVTGSLSSIAYRSGRLVATTDLGELWAQSLTEYVDTGWIQSGRVRYRTTEKKFLRSLSVEIEPLNGNVNISLIREGGSTQDVGSLTRQGASRAEPFLIGGESLRYGSVKLTFTPTDDNLSAPVLNSYQLTAYPAVPPQRLITLPLLCFDKEQAHSGQWYGGLGFAADRLTALHLIEDQAELVTFQDFTLGSPSGQLVMIDRVRFVQTSPSSSRTGVTGPGGILFLELRTVNGT